MSDRSVFDAFGSVAVVAVTDPARLGRAQAAVQGVVDAFDRACSRFREDSELARLNAAAGAPVRVSALLLDAIGAALEAAQFTDGSVSPTVGHALVALGYDRDFALVGASVPPRAPARIAPVPAWQTVHLDRDAQTVRLGRGVMLDLGATAKALAADRAASAAREAAACGVLVSLGGDLAIHGPPPRDGWLIRVTDDHRSDVTAPGQWITLHEGGLATSSTTVRRWRSGSSEAHHLVDPATGLPASGDPRTVSVTAATCLDANVAATAAIIRGAGALPWLQSLGLPSRVVARDGTVLRVAGWPSQGDDLPEASA